MAWVTKDSQETYENTEPERTYTKTEKAGNWWHYHKWQVVVVIVVLGILGAIVKDTFFRAKPDYQVAYVGEQELPVDTADALTAALETFCDDRNGDGQVLVQLNQYAINLATEAATGETAAFEEAADPAASDAEAAADSAALAEQDSTDAYVRMAVMTRLSADISGTDGSYIFLMEDPESFQATTGALRYLDGTVPDAQEPASDWQNMVYRWTDCPVLSGLDLGTYTGYTLMDDSTGNNQDVLSKLYVGCRGTWTDKAAEAYAADDVLWKTLTEGAVSTAGQN